MTVSRRVVRRMPVALGFALAVLVGVGFVAPASAQDVIVLAVKPQNLPEVLAALKGKLTPGQLALSIAAGVRISTINSGLEHECVVRAMPNTPAQVGWGITGWTATPAVTKTQKGWARVILGVMGQEIYFDDETYLDRVTAVSGSGPAYFFLFAEALTEAAIDIGLSRQEAERLVLQTMLGAAHLLEKSDRPPDELRHNVTSKGGTTEHALEVFEKNLTNGMDSQAAERTDVLVALAIGQIKTPTLKKFLPKMLRNDSKFVRIAAAKAVFQCLR